MSNSQGSKNNTTPCVVCREPILTGAQKCTKCGSYQGKRRFVFQWSGLVSALIVVVPLWGIALSLIQIAFPGKPEIKLRAYPCEKKLIVINVTNTGGQPAILGDPKLFEIRGDKKIRSRIKLKLETEKDKLIMKPGDASILQFTAVSGNVEKSDFPECPLMISFPIFDFRDRTKTAQAYCKCPE